MSLSGVYEKSFVSVCFVGLEWVGYGGVCHNEYLIIFIVVVFF